jgi:predicted phosphoribosyltransferase
MFKDRMAAADALADKLEGLRHEQPLILGIARGAVPMAARVAQALGAPWDVLLAKKLSAPHQPEFAVGAVDESGWVYRSPLVQELGIDEAYLAQEKEHQLALMRKRRAEYDAIAHRISPTGRTVIVVDDGLATGATMMAAIHGLKHQGARKVVCAVPIGSKTSVAQARQVADAVICLDEPVTFVSVSQGYRSFEQVSDQEVLSLLRTKAP